MDELEQRFVCAHEIGHLCLHDGYNRFFMDTKTLFVTSRFENEANKFAVDLIFDDNDLLEYLEFSKYDAANILGITPDLAEYRLRPVEPALY